jgi:hypothetical protein
MRAICLFWIGVAWNGGSMQKPFIENFLAAGTHEVSLRLLKINSAAKSRIGR